MEIANFRVTVILTVLIGAAVWTGLKAIENDRILMENCQQTNSFDTCFAIYNR